MDPEDAGAAKTQRRPREPTAVYPSYTAPPVGRLASALAILVCASAFAITGCGGDEESGTPLDNALSYLPKDAPFAVALDTNLSDGQYKALNELVGKFPFGDQLKQQILQSIERGGTDFD